MFHVKAKKAKFFTSLFLLPDLDSNQDKQNQNLSYYHYTIGHCCANITNIIPYIKA